MPDKQGPVLLAAVGAALVLAVVVGLAAPAFAAGTALAGTLFLNALKMLVIPLVFLSVASGVAGLGDVRRLGRLGAVTLGYYTITTGLAVFIGLVLVNLLAPGEGMQTGATALPAEVANRPPFAFSDVLLGMVPPNLVGAFAKGDVLPIVLFALALGAVLTTLGERGRAVIALVEALNEAIMKLIGFVMWATPLGVFGLVAGAVGKAGGPAFLDDVGRVGLYVVTVLLGLALHGALVLPALVTLVGRRSALAYARAAAAPLLTAFSTASSSATLPVTIRATRAAGVHERTASFVLPLGATVNMDGTALYEAVAALFIAQAYGVHLGFGEQVVVFLTATLAAIGAAGIPQAGLVTMVLVLQAVHLPVEGIGLLLVVDWALDRFRTTVNVWGDIVGCAVVERLDPPPVPPSGPLDASPGAGALPA